MCKQLAHRAKYSSKVSPNWSICHEHAWRSHLWTISELVSCAARIQWSSLAISYHKTTNKTHGLINPNKQTLFIPSYIFWRKYAFFAMYNLRRGALTALFRSPKITSQSLIDVYAETLSWGLCYMTLIIIVLLAAGFSINDVLSRCPAFFIFYITDRNNAWE